MRQTIRESGCNFHSSGNPTYTPSDVNKIPDVIDFFISKKVSPNFISIEDSYDLSSDHSAVILNLSENIVRNPRKQSLTNSSTDWMSFKLELESKIIFPIAINTVDDLENISENFIKLVQDSA